jgi:hypothetical protein
MSVKEEEPLGAEEEDGKDGSRKRTIDESLLSEDEAQKLEARRAYNRKCAANARKRSKDLISTLQKQVKELTVEKEDLIRRTDIMRAQLELLEAQNRSIMMNERGPMGPGMNMGPPGGPNMAMGPGGPGNFANLHLLEALRAGAANGMPPGAMGHPQGSQQDPQGQGQGQPQGQGQQGQQQKQQQQQQQQQQHYYGEQQEQQQQQGPPPQQQSV